MATQTVLDAVRAAPTLLEAIRAADALTIAAVSDGGGRAVRLLTRAALDPADQLTAIAAVHSLAQVFDEEADLALLRLLADERAFIREHAAWAFGGRLPRPSAVGPLLRMLRDGGFAGMLAQRTLLLWASSAPDLVALALEGALIGERDRDVRARYVETIGLVPGAIAERTLLHTAADEGEVFEARAAAADALGERPSDDAALMLARLGEMPEPLGPVARVALADRAIAPVADAGPTVAQLFVHADIDGTLTRVGAGDNGGIATLLVRLGDALTEEEGIERVLTLSRGTWAEAERALAGLPAAGHGFAPVPFVGAAVPMPQAWPRRIAAERGIRRILRSAGRVDALHLRMADVGSLAAAAVARELEIPVVFTVAPDPHALIAGLDASGALSRADFGDRDAVEHFWFRVRLVQRLAADAAHTVLFPRAELAETMRDMLGIDITAHPERHTIVPEGIDVRLVERGEEAAKAAAAGESVALDAGDDLSALDALLAELPAERRGLPLLLSVGRLHRVKGMATLAEAWAGSPLRDRANLLLVGGDLADPSPDETEQLDRIAAVATGGLLLAGHRPNGTVARWLGAVRHGRPGLAAAGGAYVCASVKEEFGIALLEALAAGLPVVAPATGGPATYVEEGVTGFLVDTTDHDALAVAACLALDVAAGPLAEYSAERGRAMVLERYTIEAMAHALSAVYARATAEQERPLRCDLVLGAS
ncbi:glycosyltransferase [Rathayibacter sp. VKM Ac-2856]|uniref:glycosyltransferase n=1 Tax=unclassified Rathayibacter TaxID=2609250 RepID=UPI001565D2C6|nr:glycosyltransferase [Rathayibacter sp. VKM Ac-2858]NQX20293.1 glycosyltransferase [Rathayibacter sp. VKM Ac-2856]